MEVYRKPQPPQAQRPWKFTTSNNPMKKRPNGEVIIVQLRAHSTACTHFTVFGRLFLPCSYLTATRAFRNILVNFVRFVLDPSTPSTFLICGIRCSLFRFTTHKSHDRRSSSTFVVAGGDWPKAEKFQKKKSITWDKWLIRLVPCNS